MYKNACGTSAKKKTMEITSSWGMYQTINHNGSYFLLFGKKFVNIIWLTVLLWNKRWISFCLC